MAIKDRIKSWLNEPEKKYNRGTAVLIGGEGFEATPDAVLDMVAKDGYQKNPFVKAGVSLIANTIATLPIILVKESKNTSDWERIYKHPVLDLLNKPNSIMGRTQLFYHLAADLSQFGHFYLHHVSPDRGDNKGVPKFLYPLMATKMKVIQGTRFRPIQSFEYEEYKKVEYSPDEIIYVRKYSPTDYWYGDSDVYSVGNVVDLNNKQIEWNKNLLKNRGVPPYYLITEGFLAADQAGQLATLADERINGSMNAGKPFVMGGGVKIEKLGFSASDLDWLKGMQETGKQILMGMGIRPELVMSTENVNAGNLKAAERSFYIQTAFPTAQTIIDAFNNKLLPMFNGSEDMKLVIDKDQVLALGEDLELTHKRVRADYLAGLTSRNESRDEIDYEPVEPDRIVEPMNVGAVGSDVDDTGRQNRQEDIEEPLPNEND
jgi:HK97 family phage portal protein